MFRATLPDTVFHAVSAIDCPAPQIDAVNVEGTKLIIALCHKYGVKRLVYTSSIEVLCGSRGFGKANWLTLTLTTVP